MASQHILLPYKGSLEEQLLLKASCDLARHRRAALTVITVVETPLSLAIDAPEIPGMAEANEALDAAEKIGTRSGVRISTAVYPCRDAGRAIVALAGRMGCDLIIMESEGPTADGASVFGQDVDHVVANAPCEVWVSRIRDKQQGVLDT